MMALLAAVHAWRELVGGLDTPDDLRLFLEGAFVPFRYALALGWTTEAEAVAQTLARDREGVSAEHALLGLYLTDPGLRPWTLISYAFLHGGWTHLILNSVWMLAFGVVIARMLGSTRFVMFFLATAIAAAVFHFLVHPTSLLPMIGASGAVSGLTGATARLMPALGGFANTQGHAAYVPSLRQAFADRRVVGFVALWIGINVLLGLGFIPIGPQDAAIAWEAHLGGFIAGFLLLPLFAPR
jgi:membrane associated rhomboid family serine protease